MKTTDPAAEKARLRAQIIKDVGRRVRTAREHKGMTRAALAARIGIDPSSVTRVEKGEQALDLPPLIAVAAVLEVSLDYLGTGKGGLPELTPAAPEEQDRRRRRQRA